MSRNLSKEVLATIASLSAGLPAQITNASISLDADVMTVEGEIACTYDENNNQTDSAVPMLTLDNLDVRIVRNFEQKSKATAASWDATLEFNMLLWPGGKGLEHLSLKYYDGPKGDGGSEFTVDEILKLSGLRLGLDFHHDSTNSWDVDAKLLIDGDDSGSATIRTGREGVGNFDVYGFYSHRCYQPHARTTARHLLGQRIPPKRIVKVALSDFPEIDAPLVGKLGQPFEQLIYMLVFDKGAGNRITPGALVVTASPDAGQVVMGGVTHAEFQTLNNKLLADDKLYFKAAVPNPAKIPPKEIVIEAGLHFMGVTKTPKSEIKAVPDYVFLRSKVPPSGGRKENEGVQELVVLAGEADVAESKQPSKAPFKKTSGPLSIENVGLTYDIKRNRLGIVLDATFLLGPIGLPLLEFGLSVELTQGKSSVSSDWAISDVSHDGSGNHDLMMLPPADDNDAAKMGSLPISNPKVTLYGLMVSFDRPPVTIARGFARTKMDDATYYAGSSIVGFLPWKLMAICVYGQVPKKKADSTSRKIIGLSNDNHIPDFGDSITQTSSSPFSVGFADISGLIAGIDINSSIRLPNVETMVDFPFTKPEGCDSLVPSPRRCILDCRRSQGDVPSLVVPVKFTHAEIGFAYVFDPNTGTFRFSAQLSPRSYVLHESCHLTGGMALYVWAKTGDFVLTLGGYHLAFVTPEACSSPPRLRISWSLSDVLRISGEAYFAVTAWMCMGGGKLNAALKSGPLSAWFDAFLEFFINFCPFKFAADGGLAVGVFGFSIDFGDRDAALRQGSMQMLSLDDFEDLVVKGGSSATKGTPAPMDWVDVDCRGHPETS
ncbi:hypothetical protein GQX73_g7911 [Xylaria multiplex]|uniref:DUF6603 domain-containing protein n=1 Tax=Xylaria multiplex TaxID=323545 RepID=A0A7C8IPD2_9PEZI|nr:hypothetical protein GQX73_g7911 [Xylaria multiplex]